MLKHLSFFLGKGFGDWTNGVLGGNKSNVVKPTLILKDELVEGICCGLRHTLLKKRNGEYWVLHFPFFFEICFKKCDF